MTEGNGREYQFDYTKKALDCIEMYQGLIAEHEETIKNLKRAIESNARSGLRIAAESNTEAADELATYLYWFYDKYVPSAVVCEFYHSYPQGIQKHIGVATFTVNCRDCKQDFDEVLRSRSHLKDLRRSKLGVCPDCWQKRRDRNSSHDQQYAAQQIERQHQIQTLRSMPYADYLKTEHWLSVRAKILKQAGFRCQVCNTKNVSLHVHHRTYVNRGCEQWGDLIVLCATCHETFHTNGSLSHE